MDRSHSKDDFRDDIFAGLTTAVMLVPRVMAYALLAGLPVEVGLYASTVPIFVYALWGTSRVLAVDQWQWILFCVQVQLGLLSPLIPR